MNRENLEKYYQSVLPMSLATAKQLTEKSEFIEIGKNELLIKENKISDKSYFLEAGFIRSYTFSSNGEEVTTNIFSAPCIVNDFLSFFKKQPSRENFQTLTECTLWWMSYQDVQTYFHTIPEFREFGRLLLVNNYSLLHERMIGMIQDTAENRYLKLIKTHSDIFQNVPLKIIASYLGITDSSLSRIRKELSQK
jgi:CRP-like cAMP-binding protein